MNRDKDAYTVGAVDRALALMTLVADRGAVGVQEAAREIGVAPSTAHRLFATLCQRDYLVQGAGRRYRPGPELLGRRAAAGIPRLVRDARPFLAEVHARAGETVHLMVLVGTRIRLVDGIESNHDLRVTLRLGVEFPAHATAGGRAILAEFDREAVAARYTNGLPPGPNPPGSDQRAASLENLLDELDAHKDRRAWFNVDQTEVGLSIISASISSPAREPKAALSIALPTARFHATDPKKLAAELIEVCQRARGYLED
ncbi:MAG TPA: IclR family transcriptional regulator C-terminal domain-containing protein [Microlunatus sp.]